MTEPGASGVESLRASPSGFDRDAFLKDVHERVSAVKHAQSSRDPDAVAGLVTPAFLGTLRGQASEQAGRGVYRRLEGLALEGTHVVRAAHDADLDRVTVRVDGRVQDYAVTEAGELLFGDRTEKAFTEYWTFSRLGAAAPGGRAECPTCGAPRDGGAGSCRYCRSQLPPETGAWLVASADDVLGG